MKWFYKLKNAYRFLIAILTIILTIILAFLEIQPQWLETALFTIFFLFAIFFIVMAIKRYTGEVKEKEKKAAEEAERERKRSPELESALAALRGEPTIQISVRGGITFPIGTKAVGVTFDDRQEYLAECEDGDDITIRHAPSNEFPESTEIIHDDTGNEIGHIKKELAMKFLKNFGKGFELYGHITEITGKEYDNLGCNIEIEGTRND